MRHHLVTADVDAYPAQLQPFRDQLEGRSMLVVKADRIDIECVARGYLAGSGWRDYQKTGQVCGIPLPDGLVESSRLSEPIFTPATKADTGHDENISFEQACDLAGEELVGKLRDLTLEVYGSAREYAEGKGVRKSRFEAVRLYREAASQGHTSAQLFLGVAYAFGDLGGWIVRGAGAPGRRETGKRSQSES